MISVYVRDQRRNTKEIPKKYQRIIADKYSFVSTGRYNHATENTVKIPYINSMVFHGMPNKHQTITIQKIRQNRAF